MSTLAFIAKHHRAVRSWSDRFRRRAIHREVNVRIRLLHGNSAAQPLAYFEAVTELGRTSEKTRSGSLKLNDIRPRVRIHEDGVRLAYQEILQLTVKVSQSWCRSSIGAEEVELDECARQSHIAHWDAEFGR